MNFTGKQLGLPRHQPKIRKRPQGIKNDDPAIVELFRAHCEAGWSARTFLAKMNGKGPAYYHMLRTNPEFKAIAVQYQQPSTRSYYPKG